MRIFSRYVLGQYLIPLVASWAVLTGIFLMDRLFLMFDLIISKGIEVRYVMEILFYSLPFVMAMSIPVATLAGAMMTFGRLAQDNEILALRSGGVRLFSVFLPVLEFTVLLSVSMVFFNLYLLPEANHRVRNMLADISSKKPTARLEEGEFNEDFPEYSIYIGRKDDRRSRIYDVTVFAKGRSGYSQISAPEGLLQTTPDERYLQMILYSSEIHEKQGANYRRIFSDTQIINLELNTALIQRERSYRSDREKNLPMLLQEIRAQNKQLQEYKTESRNPDAAGNIRKEELKLRVVSIKQGINRLWLEIHKAIAFALASLLFVCVGSALGGKLRRGGIGLAIVLSLIFFAFYYILLVGGESLAKTNRLTAWLAMWFPNIIFLPFTFELFWEVFFENSLVLRRFRR